MDLNEQGQWLVTGLVLHEKILQEHGCVLMTGAVQCEVGDCAGSDCEDMASWDVTPCSLIDMQRCFGGEERSITFVFTYVLQRSNCVVDFDQTRYDRALTISEITCVLNDVLFDHTIRMLFHAVFYLKFIFRGNIFGTRIKCAPQNALSQILLSLCHAGRVCPCITHRTQLHSGQTLYIICTHVSGTIPSCYHQHYFFRADRVPRHTSFKRVLYSAYPNRIHSRLMKICTHVLKGVFKLCLEWAGENWYGLTQFALYICVL